MKLIKQTIEKLFKKADTNFATFTVRVYNPDGFNINGASLTVVIRRLNHTPGYIPGPWQDLITVPIPKPKLLRGYRQVKIPVPLDTLTPFGQYRLRLDGCEDLWIEKRLESPNDVSEYWDGGLTDKKIYIDIIES